MQVGSLIFVVIVAIWAAYLLQHWVRRREDAAATRSVEGFSAAMRVLEKRPLLPHTDLRAPRPDSYSLKPAAGARATIDVKRAVPAGLARLSSPLVARRASEHLQARSTEIDQQHPSDALRGEVDPMPLSHSPAAPSRRSAPSREASARPVSSGSAASVPAPRHGAEDARRPIARPTQHRVSMAQRRLRAGLLLAALLWVPVSLVLAATGVLLWVSLPFAIVTLAVVLYWLRSEAEADRAHRAQQTQGRRPAPHAATVARSGAPTRSAAGAAAVRSRRAPAPAAAQAPETSSDDTQVIHHVAGAARSTWGASASVTPSSHAATAAWATRGGVFDVEAARPAATAPVAPVQEAAPGSWSPVPVPTPTYALKAKAEPRFTDDGIPADVFDTPEFADEADELDDRALFARRAVSH